MDVARTSLVKPLDAPHLNCVVLVVAGNELCRLAPASRRPSRIIVVDGSGEQKRAMQTVSRHRAILCKFCKHWYIRPCTAATQAKCPNIIAKRGSMKGAAQASFRHHYIPVFYLKRWCGDDRKICEFSRPYKRIYTKRVYPVQTGFVDRLYEVKGVPDAIAQVVEDEFMKPIDTLAAKSLSMLETNNDRIEYESKYRSAWSSFLMTMLMRMPEDLEVLGHVVADDWERDFPKMELVYAAQRQPDDPPTFQGFIDQKDPNHISRWTLDAARRLMDHERIGQRLNSMRWFVLSTNDNIPQLLTSDRPILDFLAERDAHMLLPVGPRRLFVAANDTQAEQTVRAWATKELVESVNKLVVQHAVKYVYGADDMSMKFVDDNIGKHRPKSLMQRLRDRRNEKAIAKKPT